MSGHPWNHIRLAGKLEVGSPEYPFFWIIYGSRIKWGDNCAYIYITVSALFSKLDLNCWRGAEEMAQGKVFVPQA